MTYCLGILTHQGIVMAADSRTNAGVEYISAYKKLFDFSVNRDRAILLCSSGNLSINQAIINELNRDLDHKAEINLHSLTNMYDIASYIGNKLRNIQERERPWLEKDGIDFGCNLILGGQIKGEKPQLYLIYPQGNYIQATKETPFLQIGETKYGKPILTRTVNYETSLEAVAKCAILSIDSTMKSNISVGPPINLVMYETDSFTIRHTLELRFSSPYLVRIRQLWEKSLRQAFDSMPDIEWEQNQNDSEENILID